ncbi:LIC13344 family protein [Leptospira ainazelensis]|uniref:LIC13344 family protein n=1 Tax=Leptospira ainazelensis TaxID=2810034 RepID=UPI002FCBCD8A
MNKVESATIDLKQTFFRDNLNPVVLADIEDKMIAQIAEYVKEQFPTFDWRWDDHSEMIDKAVTSLFLVKNDIVQICEKDPNKIREFISILEYILEEEYGE